MSNPSQISRLSKAALETVVELFFSVFTRTLNRKFIEFSLDAGQGELIITSKEESSDGEVGLYRGTFRWPYLKANLWTTLPHPLVVQAEYPLTFRQLRTQLWARYEIHVEENEFSLTQGGEGLLDDSLLDSVLMNQYGQFVLYATADSARFVANTGMTLIFLQPGARIPLRALFDLKAPNMLDVLAAT